MPNYKDTIMYKIVCNNLSVTDIYIGHTTNFRMRKCNHKNTCNNADRKDHNLKLYQNIRNQGGWSNWTMVEVEKYPCSDANEARKRERELYELNMGVATLNSIFPNRPRMEYLEANKDRISAQHKVYREMNNAHLNAYDKEYRETNKEKIRERMRAYYQRKKAERLAAAAIEPETVEYVVEPE